jgi:HK97 family phage major capsid protein
MAGYAVVSRQSLRNITFLQSWLPASMMEQLLDSEDSDFANTLVAAATGSATTSGVTIAVDRIVHFIKNLRKAKHSANAIMIDPDIWANILTYRSDQIHDNKEIITVDANGNVRILGRPVYDVNWLSGGRVLVGDTRKAGIVQSEGLTLRQSDSHASIFTSNETAFLLERTEGLAIFRTEAFITTTLT